MQRNLTLGGVVLALIAIALLAATFRVKTQNSFIIPSGPAGSAAYRQAVDYVACMRGYGVPDMPDPPAGADYAITVQVPDSGPVARAVRACKRLAPDGHGSTNVSVTL